MIPSSIGWVQSRVKFGTCFYFAPLRHKLFHGRHGGSEGRKGYCILKHTEIVYIEELWVLGG